MPEPDDMQYATPIPLRDNGFDGKGAPMPNPFTRLEAIRVVELRLALLATLAADVGRPADKVGLAGVLESLALALHECVWGDLATVEAVRDGARLDDWVLTAKDLIWPWPL